jgi:hypothetical protein
MAGNHHELKNQAVLSRAIEPEIPPLLAFRQLVGLMDTSKFKRIHNPQIDLQP